MANFAAESSKLSSSSPAVAIQHPAFPASGISVGFAIAGFILATFTTVFMISNSILGADQLIHGQEFC